MPRSGKSENKGFLQPSTFLLFSHVFPNSAVGALPHASHLLPVSPLTLSRAPRLLADLTRAVERLYRGRTPTWYQADLPSLPTLREWMDRVKLARASLTVRDMFGLMLCSVPGQYVVGAGRISASEREAAHATSRRRRNAGAGESLVEAILLKYPTWHALWSAYTEAEAQARRRGQDPARAAEALLAGLPVGPGMANGIGSRRTVGLEVSRKVYCHLFKARASPA